MTQTLVDWITYCLLGIFGLMIIDFLIAFALSFWAGTFEVTFLPYLKDIVFYVLPLNFILSMVSIDPTEWTLIVLYFVGALSVMIKYVRDIIRRFRPAEAAGDNE
ncbi:hypothetical protein H8B09_17430 [Paenibacillus sp. PR3]|uniref:Uncharacterized protein n=1 Tax=Paenibacillus terricola TaxID=2763503 RepID=A0ABR8N174_9BACL|nr:hypothetical protein [Paenibacillus terricola]MBD3920549.1 hypothetical protein [Paenibacillus terricola]